MVDKNDLRVVGKEILGNQNNMRVSQEKEESKVGKEMAPNGLMYSFLKENLVELKIDFEVENGFNRMFLINMFLGIK